MSDGEHTPDDPLPSLIAALDQAKATAPLLAQHARTLFLAFAEEGFDGREALYLTVTQLLGDPGRPA